MNKRTRRWLGGLALAAGAAGATLAYLKKKNMGAIPRSQKPVGNVWARPGMSVTFRAELMPGRNRDDRTFKVKELLPSGRVSLHGVEGEHTETEFESIS
jgi:hypothetical protein